VQFEPSRAQQRRVHQIRTVRCRHDDDVAPGRDAVQFDQ
jgi:hypothetical protein